MLKLINSIFSSTSTKQEEKVAKQSVDLNHDWKHSNHNFKIYFNEEFDIFLKVKVTTSTTVQDILSQYISEIITLLVKQLDYSPVLLSSFLEKNFSFFLVNKYEPIRIKLRKDQIVYKFFINKKDRINNLMCFLEYDCYNSINKILYASTLIRGESEYRNCENNENTSNASNQNSMKNNDMINYYLRISTSNYNNNYRNSFNNKYNSNSNNELKLKKTNTQNTIMSGNTYKNTVMHSLMQTGSKYGSRNTISNEYIRTLNNDNTNNDNYNSFYDTMQTNTLKDNNMSYVNQFHHDTTSSLIYKTALENNQSMNKYYVNNTYNTNNVTNDSNLTKEIPVKTKTTFTSLNSLNINLIPKEEENQENTNISMNTYNRNSIDAPTITNKSIKKIQFLKSNINEIINKDQIKREGELKKFSFSKLKFTKKKVSMDKKLLVFFDNKKEEALIFNLFEIKEVKRFDHKTMMSTLVSLHNKARNNYNASSSGNNNSNNFNDYSISKLLNKEKHIFLIRTEDEERYYFQAKNYSDLENWIESINTMVNNLKDLKEMIELDKIISKTVRKIYKNEISLISMSFSVSNVLSLGNFEEAFYSMALKEFLISQENVIERMSVERFIKSDTLSKTNHFCCNKTYEDIYDINNLEFENNGNIFKDTSSSINFNVLTKYLKQFTNIKPNNTDNSNENSNTISFTRKGVTAFPNANNDFIIEIANKEEAKESDHSKNININNNYETASNIINDNSEDNTIVNEANSIYNKNNSCNKLSFYIDEYYYLILEESLTYKLQTEEINVLNSCLFISKLIYNYKFFVRNYNLQKAFDVLKEILDFLDSGNSQFLFIDIYYSYYNSKYYNDNIRKIETKYNKNENLNMMNKVSNMSNSDNDIKDFDFHNFLYSNDEYCDMINEIFYNSLNDDLNKTISHDINDKSSKNTNEFFSKDINVSLNYCYAVAKNNCKINQKSRFSIRNSKINIYKNDNDRIRISKVVVNNNPTVSSFLTFSSNSYTSSYMNNNVGNSNNRNSYFINDLVKQDSENTISSIVENKIDNMSILYKDDKINKDVKSKISNITKISKEQSVKENNIGNTNKTNDLLINNNSDRIYDPQEFKLLIHHQLEKKFSTIVNKLKYLLEVVKLITANINNDITSNSNNNSSNDINTTNPLLLKYLKFNKLDWLFDVIINNITFRRNIMDKNLLYNVIIKNRNLFNNNISNFLTLPNISSMSDLILYHCSKPSKNNINYSCLKNKIKYNNQNLSCLKRSFDHVNGNSKVGNNDHGKEEGVEFSEELITYISNLTKTNFRRNCMNKFILSDEY